MRTTRREARVPSRLEHDHGESRARRGAQPLSAVRPVEGADRVPDITNRPCGGYMIGGGTSSGFTLGSGMV